MIFPTWLDTLAEVAAVALFGCRYHRNERASAQKPTAHTLS